MSATWATADEFYGGDRHLRRDLQVRGVGYVLAVAKSHRVTARAVDGPARADQLVAVLPARAWNRISAGAGSKGDRNYDWAWITIIPPAGETSGQHSLLVRRRISDGELAFYRCWSPRPVPLRTLVRVAGVRWNVERPASRPASGSAWTSRRYAAGTPGTGTSPWSCSPTPSSPSSPPANATVTSPAATTP